MRCPACHLTMTDSYCESWTTYTHEYGEECEYLRHLSYWSCPGCNKTITEDDDEYEAPQ